MKKFANLHFQSEVGSEIICLSNINMPKLRPIQDKLVKNLRETNL